MDEKEAKKLLGPRCTNDSHCDLVYTRGEACGFLTGLEAERLRVKPLVEAAEKCDRYRKLGLAVEPLSIPAQELFIALAAYTTPQNDGQRDSGVAQ